MELITSSSNPKVKQARALRQRKSRQATGFFLVEGVHPVGAAFEAGWQFESIFYAPDLLTSGYALELIAKARDKGSQSAGLHQELVHPVSIQVMESMTEKDNPQGLIAVVRQKTSELGNLAGFESGVALVSPQDPGNLGAILRTMDAVGAQVLFLLDGGVDPFHPTAVRSSMGALFWIPVVQSDFDGFAAWAGTARIQLISTSAHAKVDYRTLVPEKPWVLVLGTEQKGLSPAQQAACAASVSLPMHGKGGSLNLAVATGILLYHYLPAHGMPH